MDITQVQAVDVHAHYGVYRGSRSAVIEECMTGLIDTVVARARQARTRLSVISPMAALLPRGKADVIAGNAAAVRDLADVPELLLWAVLNPLLSESFDQAAELLRLPTCVGIKIHPEEHCYPVSEHGRKAFAFAAEHQA